MVKKKKKPKEIPIKERAHCGGTGKRQIVEKHRLTKNNNGRKREGGQGSLTCTTNAEKDGVFVKFQMAGRKDIGKFFASDSKRTRRRGEGRG